MAAPSNHRGGVQLVVLAGTVLVAVLGAGSRASAQQRIYITDSETSRIERASLNGSEREVVVTETFFPTRPTIDTAAEHLYWLTPSAIMRASLDGSGRTTIVDGLSRPTGLALELESGWIFWSEFDVVRRSALDGSGIIDVLTGIGSVRDVEVDPVGGKLYVAKTDGIHRANLDGSDLEQITTEPAYHMALDIPGDTVYWIDIGDSLRRASLDGSNVSEVAVLPRPRGLAIFHHSNGEAAAAYVNSDHVVLRVELTGDVEIGVAVSGRRGSFADLAIDDRTVTASSVSIDPETIEAHVGFPTRASLLADATGDGTRDVTGAAAWTSTDAGVASVSPLGIVRGVAEGGATVEARYQELAPASSAAIVQAAPSQLDVARVSVAADGTQVLGWSEGPTMSGDGRFVAFTSDAAGLVPDDTNGVQDVFVVDCELGSIARVSVGADGAQGDGFSDFAEISGDGRAVVFRSSATNLVPDDTNGTIDIFLRDLVGETTERVNVASDGTQANSFSYPPVVSADGRVVAFGSFATNLVPDDTNGQADVFVRDRASGTTERVNVSTSGEEGNGSGNGFFPSISASGRYVAFRDAASNLVEDDTNGSADVFLRDREAGTTERVNISSAGEEADIGGLRSAIAGDGRFVFFDSSSTNLVDDDTNDEFDVFMRDRQNATTVRISLDAEGSELAARSFAPRGTPDGRWVAFYSEGRGLVGGLGDDHTRQTYVRDLATGRNEIVSSNFRSEAGDSDVGAGERPGVSDDGRTVAFSSWAANLVPFDTNVRPDVFVRALPAVCPADLDGSGAVDFGDILAILAAWGNAGGPEDLDDSGAVDFGDILIVLSSWGPCA